MPRKPRIEIDGYYHVVNRGVEQRVVFNDPDDYAYFEELMCFHARNHGITLHNYCLMPNHYHLLIEVTNQTLSKYMRQLNMNYAIYFNKKYKRVGHLWQGRFKSWYVTDEAYFYTLMGYIEQNPLKAGMVKRLEAYPYSSFNHFLSRQRPECLQASWIVQNYQQDTEAIRAFLYAKPDSSQLYEMKKASSLVDAPNTDTKPKAKDLEKIFKTITGIPKRNEAILRAYQQGYSQHMIAKTLGMAQSTIHGIVKRMSR